MRLDPELLAPDLRTMLTFTDENHSYSEFHVGNWKTFVLWNQSGEEDDGLVANRLGAIRVTPRASRLDYVNRLIERTFHLDALKLVRLHRLEDGVLIPHRDYVELRHDPVRWVRIHVPLQTNEGCLHSENDKVFRMRPGEIWHLNAAETHSACNRGQAPRLSLCLDFEIGDAPLETVLRHPVPRQRIEPPVIVERAPLTNDFLDGLYALRGVIGGTNYREIVSLLARVHFYRDVDIREFYRWLVDISEASGDGELHRKSVAFARFLFAEREMGERFVL
jgi:L-proline 3-hydroxylase, C-terminal/Aspartyl/Asparaginyl beta-hydroxylase